MKKFSLRRGFTLIEILVVLGIIGVLAALLFPVLGRARENGRRSVCSSNLHQMGLAVQQYADDYDHQYPHAISPNDEPILDALFDPVPDPPPPSYPPLLMPYLKSKELLRCPSDTGWWKIRPKTNFEVYSTSYDYNYGVWAADKTRSTVASHPERIVLFLDTDGAWHSDSSAEELLNSPDAEAYQVVCADLHVKRILDSQWSHSSDSDQ